MATAVADRDALFQKARTELAAGRIGNAIDWYKGLADAGDWRGYEGLLNIAGASDPKPATWKYSAARVACRYQDKFANPKILRALFPDGFSIAGTIEVMESNFGSYDGCKPLIDAAKDAAYNHPYVAFESVACVAKSLPVNEKVDEFIYAFGKGLGLDKGTADRLLQLLGATNF